MAIGFPFIFFLLCVLLCCTLLFYRSINIHHPFLISSKQLPLDYTLFNHLQSNSAHVIIDQDLNTIHHHIEEIKKIIKSDVVLCKPNETRFDTINITPKIQNHKAIDSTLNKPIEVKLSKIIVQQKLGELLKNIVDTLEWIVREPQFNRWDWISVADIHILNKLRTYLQRILLKINDDSKEWDKFLSMLTNGYQCTAMESTWQETIAKKISMDICSEVEWYKLAQLTYPTATQFLDIGANKGYLGSLFIGLWGDGGSYGVFPAKLFDITTNLKTWKGSRNPAGYCKDGYNYGVALSCETAAASNSSMGLRDVIQGGLCHSRLNPNLSVISIDGSSYLTNTMNTIITSEFNHPRVRSGQVWKYYNYAVSNQEGSVRFTKQDKDLNAGFEGGSIRAIVQSSRRRRLRDDYTEVVSMTSVDRLVERLKLPRVDVMKIDTEGNDNKVLLGAKRTIQHDLGLFTFEGGKGVVFTEAMMNEWNQLGYSCYSTSRAGLFKWSGGCMKSRYFGGFNAKDKGNIFCVHRDRSPWMAMAFDILSFPIMMHEYLRDEKTSPDIRSKFLSGVASTQGIQSEDFIPIYINIKPFCSPWPQCISIKS